MQTSAPDQNTPTPAFFAGESAILARRYALALFELAQEQHAADKVAEQMAALQHLLSESPDFRNLVADPRVTRDQMAAAFKTVGEQAKLDGMVVNFLALVAQNRRAALLPQILAAFAAEQARRAGEMIARVRAARPLSAQQQQQLAAHLATATGHKVRLQVTEDPALIGGMIVNYGSIQIDASLQGRLASLTRQLREAA